MKYPWTKYTRRKNNNRRNANKSHRGTMWIVDLSSQYWTALLTEREQRQCHQEIKRKQKQLVRMVTQETKKMNHLSKRRKRKAGGWNNPKYPMWEQPLIDELMIAQFPQMHANYDLAIGILTISLLLLERLPSRRLVISSFHHLHLGWQGLKDFERGLTVSTGTFPCAFVFGWVESFRFAPFGCGT